MKTTKKDFEFFKKECDRYANLFGLDDWSLIYEKDYSFVPNTRASCAINLNACQTEIALAKDWQHEKVTRKQLSETAKHEVLHILLAPVMVRAMARYTAENDLISAEHSIIQKLMKLLP